MGKSLQSVYMEDKEYIETLKAHPRQCFAEIFHLLVEEHKIVHRQEPSESSVYAPEETTTSETQITSTSTPQISKIHY